MKREKHLAFEHGIADTRNRFDEWRKKRKSRREPIPSDLLDLAAAQCREFPYTKVAKALKINPSTLKTRISRDIPPGIKKTTAVLDFVEMKMQQQTTGFISQSPACEILIACPGGRSIKIVFANMPPKFFNLSGFTYIYLKAADDSDNTTDQNPSRHRAGRFQDPSYPPILPLVEGRSPGLSAKRGSGLHLMAN